ncbi:MAG: hypothetical protein ACRDZ7_09030 [Acidimicrobiia bacterium]
MSNNLVCAACGHLAESARALYLHGVNSHAQYQTIDPSDHERPRTLRDKRAAKQQQESRQQEQLVCPHCQTKGSVSASRVIRKKGISGGKATGALLTGGVSLLVTGLARKEAATEASCRNCGMTWVI